MSQSSLKRFLSSVPFTAVMIVGYLALMHYGWQKLQYSPVVNGGEEPTSLNLDKFKKVFVGEKKSDDVK